MLGIAQERQSTEAEEGMKDVGHVAWPAADISNLQTCTSHAQSPRREPSMGREGRGQLDRNRGRLARWLKLEKGVWGRVKHAPSTWRKGDRSAMPPSTSSCAFKMNCRSDSPARARAVHVSQERQIAPFGESCVRAALPVVHTGGGDARRARDADASMACSGGLVAQRCGARGRVMLRPPQHARKGGGARPGGGGRGTHDQSRTSGA